MCYNYIEQVVLCNNYIERGLTRAPQQAPHDFIVANGTCILNF